MDDDEWMAVCFLIEQAFKGDFDDNKRAVYRRFLGGMPLPQVEAAVYALAEEGQEWLPAAGQILIKARTVAEEPVPGWTEVYRWLMRAQAAAPREAGFTASDTEKTRAGAAWLEGRCHAVVARFYEAEGFGRLSRIQFGDEEYGELRIKELRERFEEFVGVAKERLANGMALAAVGERAELGPRRLDEAALLERYRPAPAGELEERAGE